MLPDPTPEQRQAFRDLTGREMRPYPEQGKFARAMWLIFFLIIGLICAGGLTLIYNPFEV